MKDEAGQAMTEYALLMLVVCGLCFFLYHPDNGFYKKFRNRYELTSLMLILPGP